MPFTNFPWRPPRGAETFVPCFHSLFFAGIRREPLAGFPRKQISHFHILCKGRGKKKLWKSGQADRLGCLDLPSPPLPAYVIYEQPLTSRHTNMIFYTEMQKVGDTGDISLLFLKKITLYNPLASDILSKNWLKFDFKLLTEYSSFEHSQSCPWQREEYGGLWVIRLLMWQNDRLHNLIFWKFDHNSNSIAPLIKCGGWWVVPSSIYLMCVWLCEVVAVLILRIVGYTIHKTLQS